ncbi:MAG: serine/threonine protein kinase, partial [Planctomycetota bacterium]
MVDERHCNECGGKLPADAPQGLCPQCLMKLGLPSEGRGEKAVEQAGMATIPTPPGGFIPPDPKELAEKFPQLEIFELLGQGGMGAVYKARQKQLDRLVALKILPPQVGQDPAFAERFSREARSLAKLNHSRIVSIYDFGHTEDGLYYFIMEFVDGTDLRHVIEGGHLEPAEALAIVPQICEALQYAHEEGLVHRDIKPENILLDKKGKVKIADFGLAKLLGKPATAYTLTQAGQRMGTPHYMAPEQIEGAHKVDHRADIYSLGVVFYEMLTGQLPIGRFAPPSQKVQVDVRLDDVVLKSLEHEPEQRYQKVSEVRSDVERISQCEQPLTRVEQEPEARFSRRAIAAAACIPLAVPLFVMLSTKEGYDRFENLFTPTGENWGQWFFTFIVSIVGIAAPFATTILGCISLSEIRRSRGRLVGLPLALADAILFPLIVVDFLIFVIFLSNYSPFSNPRLIPLVLLICAVVDLLLIRWAWRKAKAGTERPKPGLSRGYPAAPAAASSAKTETLQDNRRIEQVETEVESAHKTVPGTRALSLIVSFREVYAGFAEAHGILRFEGDYLGLEYQIEDGIFGAIKSSVKTARIPLDQIASIKVKAGLRKTKMTLRTSTWKALDNVPGSKAGLVTLEISREHKASAQSFIEQLKEKLPEGTIEGY